MTLTKGDSGPEVQTVQEQLKALGFYDHEIDGVFGSHTRKAVLEFQDRYFVDGIVDRLTLRALTEAVEAWNRRERMILIDVPRGQQEVERQFGRIEYREAGGGYLTITNGWADKYIERVDLPVVGRQAVNRLLVPSLRAVFTELQLRGLDREVFSFGCWCPRHQRHDPRLPLSAHSWAIAIDINAATNAPGTVGDLHSGIVEVFERFGFEWGGRWNHYRDYMHFQYCTGM